MVLEKTQNLSPTLYFSLHPRVLRGLAILWATSLTLFFSPSSFATPWVEVYSGGQSLCARGEPFSFFYRPGTVNRLLIHFMGGGTCWNAETCQVGSPSFTTSIDYARNMLGTEVLDGFLNFSRPENPFTDWHVAIIPYCTGDIHWGAKDTTYTTAEGSSYTVYHRGAQNVASVYDWLARHIKAPTNIFSTGCSAGGYGALYHAPRLRNHYPKTELALLADGAVGIIDPSVFRQGLPAWGATILGPTWVPGLNPAFHPWEYLTIVDLYRAIANHDRPTWFGQVTSDDDGTQVFFYDQSGGDPSHWSTLARQSLTAIDQSVSSFSYFLAPGDEHCYATTPEFYDLSVNGISFLEWTESFAYRLGPQTVEQPSHAIQTAP